MFKLHIIQADHDDCYLLEYGASATPCSVLIGGAPASSYAHHLLPVLQTVAARCGKLALMVLTHIDDDHIAGLLELLIELRQQRMEGFPETIGIEEIWHNTFSQVTSPEIEQRVALLPRQSVGCVAYRRYRRRLYLASVRAMN
ncbi:MAG: hypothetical protein R3E79_10915 [Caldilineaceae bacterium]